MSKATKIKLGLFLAIVGAFIAIKQFTPVGEQMTIENLQALIEPLGAWGLFLFVIAFGIGNLFQVPGFLFYSASFAMFGPVQGAMVAYVGSIAAVMVSFLFARHLGGKVLTEIKNERIQRILAKLEQSPVLVIGVLRALLWVAPPVNYALAFSSVSSRKYILGSCLGLILPIAFMAFGANLIFPG